MIDRLEALVNAGTRVPLTSKALIDEQEFLELVDQLRVSLPDEVKHAKRATQDRDRVIQQARLEAEKEIAQARDRAEQLVADSAVLHDARQQAEVMLNETVAECRHMREDADAYVLGVLEGLENELGRTIASIRKGKAALDRTRRPDERYERDGAPDATGRSGA